MSGPEKVSVSKPSNLDAKVGDVRDRVEALFAWQLTEGQYELIPPVVPISVPSDFKPKPGIRSTEISYSYSDSRGKKISVTLTEGATELGAGSGLKEDPEDMTVDISNLPYVVRFRKNGDVSADLRTTNALEVGWEPNRNEFYNGRSAGHRIVPAESERVTRTHIRHVNEALNKIGHPDNSSVDIKTTERSRSRVLHVFQRD